jgi:hypothetical protein
MPLPMPLRLRLLDEEDVDDEDVKGTTDTVLSFEIIPSFRRKSESETAGSYPVFPDRHGSKAPIALRLQMNPCCVKIGKIEIKLKQKEFDVSRILLEGYCSRDVLISAGR